MDPDSPDPGLMARIALMLKKGQVVGIPTTGLYGLAADAMNAEAIRRVFALKNRPPDKPLLILIAYKRNLPALVKNVPDAAQALIDAFWPGGLTLVFEAASLLPPALSAGTGKVGIRMAAHPVARDLVRSFGGPITGTSANLSGEEAPGTVDQVSQQVIQGCASFLDAGPLEGGPGSTVVDVTVEPIRILRQGSISKEKILNKDFTS